MAAYAAGTYDCDLVVATNVVIVVVLLHICSSLGCGGTAAGPWWPGNGAGKYVRAHFMGGYW